MSDENRARDRAKKWIKHLKAITEHEATTEQEALNAAEKIGELLKQYDLEISEIDLRDEPDCVTKQLYAPDEAAIGIVRGAAKLCSLVYYRKSGASPPTFVVFGRPQDVELALYLYVVCTDALDHEWVAFQRRTGVKTKKACTSFRLGFGERIAARLNQLRAQRDAEAAARAVKSGNTNLVVLKDQLVAAEWETHGVKLVMIKAPVIHDRAAFLEGHRAAETTNLNNPLEDGRETVAGRLEAA